MVRNRYLVGGVALVILALLFIPVLNFSTGTPRANSLASAGAARVALDQLDDSGIGAGALNPFEVAVIGGDADAVAKAAAGAEGVRGAVAPERRRRGGNGDLRVVNVFPEAEDSPSTVDSRPRRAGRPARRGAGGRRDPGHGGLQRRRLRQLRLGRAS